MNDNYLQDLFIDEVKGSLSGGRVDHTIEDQLVDGSIKGVYENNRVSKVNAMRFYSLDGPEEFRSTSATLLGTGRE